MFTTIDVSTDDRGVCRLTLNRPQALNAWVEDMATEVREALEACKTDPAVRTVVISGAGRAFSAGADLKSIQAGEIADVGVAMREHYNPTILALRHVPKPVIAAVNGPAAGYGASFALACDLIVAARSSYLLLAFARVGLCIDGGASVTVPARAGIGRAAQMALLADRIAAPTANAWGLIDEVVDDDALATSVDALAGRLAAGPVGAYASIKSVLNRRLLPDLEAGLEAEAVEQEQRTRSADHAEGVAAFLQGRAPSFV